MANNYGAKVVKKWELDKKQRSDDFVVFISPAFG
jgi:hypothetical protein